MAGSEPRRPEGFARRPHRAGRLVLVCLATVLCWAWRSDGDTGVRARPGVGGVPELVLAEGGMARAVIVALPEAGEVARFAAAELSAYLTRATGAPFEILNAMPSTGPVVLVGDCQESRRRGVTVDDLKRDGYVLKRVDNVIVVAGRDDKAFAIRAFADLTGSKGNPRQAGWRRNGIPECATAFAAYAFLETATGIRWYFPGPEGEFVPQRDRLAVGALERTDEPRFTYRWPYRCGHRSLDPKWPNDLNDYVDMGIKDRDVTYWILRNRRSTRHIPVNHMPPSHRFVERFGASHPEWFSLPREGTRESAPLPGGSRATYGHLCYSHPELVQAVAADVDAFFSGRPASDRGLTDWKDAVANGDAFSLLPHDNIREGCHCPACTAKKNVDGPECALLSDLVWSYVAEVGRATESRHPGKDLVCLAYNTYRGLPRHVRLPANVIPCPTALHTGNEHDNLAQERIIREIRQWRAAAGRPVALWVYSALECVDGSKLRGIPQTEFRAMSRFYRAVQDDVIGSFWENDWAFGFQHHLDLYVYFRVTWDPETDVDAVVAEYCRNLYGPAAGEIHGFLNRVEALWTRQIVQSHAQIGGAAYRDIDATSDADLWENIYNPAEMQRLSAALDSAEERVRDTAYAPRVDLFRRRFFEPLLARSRKRRELEALWESLVPLPVDRFAVPPVLDGRPDETVWTSAPAESVGTMVTSAADHPKATPAQGTTVTLGWDDRNLYILFACRETRLAQRQAPVRTFNDLGIAEDDEVEVFLDPAGARRGYRHLLINAGGALANRYVHNGVGTLASTPACRVQTWAAETGEGGTWYVEMAIPFGYHVGGPPQPGDRWVANFTRARNATEKTEYSTWCPLVQGGFNQPEKFGIIVFTDRTRR